MIKFIFYFFFFIYLLKKKKINLEIRFLEPKNTPRNSQRNNLLNFCATIINQSKRNKANPNQPTNKIPSV